MDEDQALNDKEYINSGQAKPYPLFKVTEDAVPCKKPIEEESALSSTSQKPEDEPVSICGEGEAHSFHLSGEAFHENQKTSSGLQEIMPPGVPDRVLLTSQAMKEVNTASDEDGGRPFLEFIHVEASAEAPAHPGFRSSLKGNFGVSRMKVDINSQGSDINSQGGDNIGWVRRASDGTAKVLR